MSRREDIHTSMWSDSDFLALTAPAKLTYIWSWTNSHCGMAGLYKIAPSLALLETGQDHDTFTGAMEELADARFAFYEDGVMFVRSRVKHMRQKTEQIAKAIRADIAKVGVGHPLRVAWVLENATAPWLVRFLGEGWESDGQATLTGPSTEAHENGPLGPNPGGSTEGQPTLLGNGNGNGTGKGKGKGNSLQATRALARIDRAKAWAVENLPDLPADFVAQIYVNMPLGSSPEQVRASVLAAYPSLREDAA